MRELVIQQNEFLEDAKIVPIIGIIPRDIQQVEDILCDSVYFKGMRSTMKTISEGKYILVTIKRNLY